MSDMTSVDEILDFAIKNEQDAVDLYTGLATTAKSASIKKAFEQFAGEEAGHRKRLEEVKNGKRLIGSAKAIQDLKISDYLVDKELGDDPDYQDVLIFAMHQEKAAFRLYSDLSAKAEDAGLQTLFLELAQEEAKHKLRFEVEYDDVILKEN